MSDVVKRVSIAAGAFALVACRTPTEITVEVTASDDLPCARFAGGGAAVAVGELTTLESTPPATTSTACTSAGLGSVVIVPSGSDDAHVAFKVIGAIDGASIEECSNPPYGKSCIVARRSLAFLPHTSVSVPVKLSAACAGHPCDDPTQTCVEGACVSAEIDPSRCTGSGGCPEGVLFPGVSGGDAGTDAGIDATLNDAGADAAGVDASDASDASEAADASDASEGGATFDGSFDAAVLGCDLGGLQANAPWPMEGYCPSHRFKSPLPGPSAQPNVLWKYVPRGSGTIDSPPSIGAGGVLYIGSDDSTVDAIDPSDGGILWEYRAGMARFEMMPALAADDTVRIVSADSLYAELHASDGGLRVGVPAPASRGGLTIGGDGTMYFSDNTNKLVQMIVGGTQAWAVPALVNDYVLPSIAQNGLILTGRGGLALATRVDGGLAWSSTLDGGNVDVQVAVAVDGTLRALTSNGGVFKLTQSGAPVWGSWFATDGQGLAVADDGTAYVGSNNEGLVAIDANGGRAGVFADRCGQPVVDVDGDVYAVCTGPSIVALSPSLATTRWRKPIPTSTGAAFFSSPVIGPGQRIYVKVTYDQPDAGAGLGSRDAIYAFGP